MRKEIKKLIAATMSMALVLGVGNTVNIKAGTESKIKAESFCFEIKSHCAASRNPGSIKRTSHKTDNAWSVDFRKSNESGSGRTSTRFYLGKVIPNHTNEYGSALHTIQEGSGNKYYSAYSKVCPATVCLYGRDNDDGISEKYTVSGYWSPQTWHDPTNDGDK